MQSYIPSCNIEVEFMKNAMKSCMPDCFLLILVSLILSYISRGEDEGCDSPQFLEMGKTGVIQCFFENFSSLLWYNSAGSDLGTPILRLTGSEKSGMGYRSGKYDIYSNGSLIIHDVWYLHDRIFTAVKVSPLAKDLVHFQINVKSVVKSVHPHPSLSVCGRNNRSCFAQVNDASELRCSVWNTRPAVPLQWFVRTNHGDEIVKCIPEMKRDNLTQTSHCVVENTFQTSALLSLLVCQANNKHGLLLEDEAYTMVESNEAHQKLPDDEPNRVIVARGSSLKLPCTGEVPHLIVWKKSRTAGGDVDVLAYGAFLRNMYLKKIYYDEYELQNNGSLVVPNTEIHHEGFYHCFFQNEVFGAKRLFEVIVYASAYPEVTGCTQSRYCVLETQTEGNLTCSVTGIHPRVQLEWRPAYDYQSSLITFTEQEVIITENEGTFDVYVTSQYHIQSSSINRVTVECAIVDTDIAALKVTTSLDLLHRPVAQTRNEPLGISWKQVVMIISISVGITVVIIGLVACLIWRCCCRDEVKEDQPEPTKV